MNVPNPESASECSPAAPKERLQLMEHPLIAQMETARLRRENRHLRRRNALLLAGFVVGAALGGLAAWLAPAGWFPL